MESFPLAAGPPELLLPLLLALAPSGCGYCDVWWSCWFPRFHNGGTFRYNGFGYSVPVRAQYRAQSAIGIPDVDVLLAGLVKKGCFARRLRVHIDVLLAEELTEQRNSVVVATGAYLVLVGQNAPQLEIPIQWVPLVRRALYVLDKINSVLATDDRHDLCLRRNDCEVSGGQTHGGENADGAAWCICDDKVVSWVEVQQVRKSPLPEQALLRGQLYLQVLQLIMCWQQV